VEDGAGEVDSGAGHTRELDCFHGDLLSSPSLRYFSLSLSVQPCYNPIEIQSMPPCRFVKRKQDRKYGEYFFEELSQWRLPMSAAKP
jgi:hypothetical protein